MKTSQDPLFAGFFQSRYVVLLAINGGLDLNRLLSLQRTGADFELGQVMNRQLKRLVRRLFGCDDVANAQLQQIGGANR